MKPHSILIGPLVMDRLLASQVVSDHISNRMFALVADNRTKFPFLVFTRESINEGKRTKDGCISDIVTFRIDTLAATYNESVLLADAVRECLEVPVFANNDIIVRDTFLAGSTESWDSDTYIQQLRFTCEVTNA